MSEKSAASSRRNFLKIGAGVVAGAAVASVVEIPYYSSIVGGNNNSSSTTVSSLQDQLQTTQSELSNTQDSLSAAQGTISTLNNQLSATQSQLGSVNSQLGSAQSAPSAANSQNSSLSAQNTTLSSQVNATQTSLNNANNTISSLEAQVTSANSNASSLQAQASSLQVEIDTTTAFQTLSVNEQSVLTAIVNTFIPTDSNGPGGVPAGVLYFIDGQLSGKYGSCGAMYMQGPFVPGNLTTPVTVGGITFSAGTMPTPLDAGQRYQYNINLRDYWRLGLGAVEAYANTAYGGNFETLSAANQTKCLQDIYNNVPKTFSNILPQDFYYELYFMTWCGYLTDPMYGGNKGMVGWSLVGFNGTNQGNFYGEGFTPQQLMLSTTPTLLKPASLGQFQKGSP